MSAFRTTIFLTASKRAKKMKGIRSRVLRYGTSSKIVRFFGEFVFGKTNSSKIIGI